MENKYYLYQHIRLDNNEIFYIGIGSKNNYKRAYSRSSRNRFWNFIINKTEYKVEILFDKISFEEACNKEIELIAKYGRRDLNQGSLVNLTNGGDGVKSLIFTKETREKISKANKGLKRSEETKKRMSESFKGRKYSIESINKRKQTMINYKHTEETINKIRNKAIGRKHTKTEKMINHMKKLQDPEIVIKRIENLARGENHGKSKLRTEDVIKIKQLFKEKIQNKEIYKLFPNVSSRAIRLIKEGKNWNHIKI